MRPLPFDLADLQAFVAVVDLGSLTKAAERLRTSKSVLSRRIASLEFAFGTQLLFRDRRGARATATGESLHQTASEVLGRLEQVHDEASAGRAELAGHLRITAPLSFGATYLAPVLADFANLHPAISLDVRLDDHVVDLLAEGFDLALRIGREPEPELGARKLAAVRPHLLASPAYLARRGRPLGPADLSGHDVIEYTNHSFDFWQASFGPEVDPADLNVRFRSDNGELQRAAAVVGLGLVILPDFLVRDAVDAGELEILFADRPFAEAGLYAVPVAGRPKLRRVRALSDHLAAAFGPQPPWAVQV